MLCMKADLSIGSMIGCKTCLHPFSGMYVMKSHLQTLTGKVLISSAKLLWWSSFGCSCVRFIARRASCIFWCQGFNPFTNSHPYQKLDMAFSNENEKKQNHNQQVFEVKQFAPSALFRSYHMAEMAEKPSNFSVN